MLIIVKIVERLVSRGYLPPFILNLLPGAAVYWDARKKFFFNKIDEDRIYLAKPAHGLGRSKIGDLCEYLCSEIYYKHYLPQEGDICLDVGSGYGHELVWLKKHSRCQIIAIEPNPLIFYFLSYNTRLLEGCTVLNTALSKEVVNLELPFDDGYAGLSHQADAPIKIKTHTFHSLMSELKLHKISLLKLNIEGGELSFLSEVVDLSCIERIVVSCHDFRAERGEGEYFRTYDSVCRLLRDSGFSLRGVQPSQFPNESWKKSISFWIYAERGVTDSYTA